MNDLKGVDPMDVDHPYEWLKNEFKKGRIWSLSQHISQYMYIDYLNLIVDPLVAIIIIFM